MNIALIAEMSAAGGGDRVAVECGQDTLSYEQLYSSALQVGGWLAAGDAQTLAYLGGNAPAFPVALFAAAASGRSFCPLNYRWTAAELQRALRRITPAVVVVDADQHPRLEQLATAVEGITVCTVEDLHARAAGALALSGPEPEPQAPAVLLFTSGTSGEPKMAVLRHTNLCSYIFGTVDFLSADPDDAQLISLPPYHVGGIANLLSCLYAGRRIVQLPAFDASDWVRTASAAQISHAMVVPTMLARILAVLDEPLPRLRHLSYGGGRISTALITEAVDRLPHVDFVNGYGLTETSSSITVLGPEDHRQAVGSDDPAHRLRLQSVGRPLPGVEIEIRDEIGAVLSTGDPGEVWVRGPQVSGEYVGVGSLVDAEGWFRTKDAGWSDPDGYLFISGRLDDVIVRGGENISPGEVEDVLLDHPDVEAVAVVGLPDPEWGEVVAAAVVPRQVASSSDERMPIDDTQLREFVRARLRSAKAPSFIAVVDQLPYNETGKLLRRKVRETLGDARASTLQSG